MTSPRPKQTANERDLTETLSEIAWKMRRDAARQQIARVDWEFMKMAPGMTVEDLHSDGCQCFIEFNPFGCPYVEARRREESNDQSCGESLGGGESPF